MVARIARPQDEGALDIVPDPGPQGITPMSQHISIFAALTLHRSRERAYRAFEWSLLLSIFVIQPFAFYEEPYIAELVLAVTIPLLATIDYLVRRERDEDEEDDLAHDGATAAARAADDGHGAELAEPTATGGD